MENGGISSRHLIFVGDMARGCSRAPVRGNAGEVYNLASGVETTIRELAELVNDCTGNPTPIGLKPARDWDHSGQRYGSTDKAGRELGFEAGTPLREGLERTIEWTREERRLDRALHGAGTPTGCPTSPRSARGEPVGRMPICPELVGPTRWGSNAPRNAPAAGGRAAWSTGSPTSTQAEDDGARSVFE